MPKAFGVKLVVKKGSVFSLSIAAFIRTKPMSTMITVEAAQASLKSLIHQLAPGDEVIITENEQPVARLVSESAPRRHPRTPGNCKGMIALLVEDDEHLDGFCRLPAMRLLLDTHAFLWFVTDDPQLSATARALIVDPTNDILVSPASYWETATQS